MRPEQSQRPNSCSNCPTSAQLLAEAGIKLVEKNLLYHSNVTLNFFFLPNSFFLSPPVGLMAFL